MICAGDGLIQEAELTFIISFELHLSFECRFKFKLHLNAWWSTICAGDGLIQEAELQHVMRFQLFFISNTISQRSPEGERNHGISRKVLLFLAPLALTFMYSKFCVSYRDRTRCISRACMDENGMRFDEESVEELTRALYQVFEYDHHDHMVIISS